MIPKFRAWVEAEETMHPVLSLDWSGIGDNLTVFVPMGHTSSRAVSIDNVVLMQSTGVFDKNGQEIFEGDVVVAMSQGVKAIGEVKRRIDGYWLMYPSWQHGELWHIVENVDTGETGVEVIGNIYENPELVEVNND
ncbi:hypothetical protein HCC60_05700 [Streptococcus suis]|nr:hypothetical protein [Streptococcus suis]